MPSTPSIIARPHRLVFEDPKKDPRVSEIDSEEVISYRRQGLAYFAHFAHNLATSINTVPRQVNVLEHHLRLEHMQAQRPMSDHGSEARAVQLASEALKLVASGRAEVHRCFYEPGQSR